MANIRRFYRKLYCANCGKLIIFLRIASKEDAHIQNMDILYNHEACGNAGTAGKKISYSEIYPKKQEKASDLDADVLRALSSGEKNPQNQ